jgi:protein-S-isoprenylcysteine O-methyltransferase Ste14
MSSIPTSFLLIATIVAINLMALVSGRRGVDARERLGFRAALAAMGALPVLLLSMVALALQFMFVRWQSPSGIAFLLSATVVATGTLLAAATLWWPRHTVDARLERPPGA